MHVGRVSLFTGTRVIESLDEGVCGNCYSYCNPLLMQEVRVRKKRSIKTVQHKRGHRPTAGYITKLQLFSSTNKEPNVRYFDSTTTRPLLRKATTTADRSPAPLQLLLPRHRRGWLSRQRQEHQRHVYLEINSLILVRQDTT